MKLESPRYYACGLQHISPIHEFPEHQWHSSERRLAGSHGQH